MPDALPPDAVPAEPPIDAPAPGAQLRPAQPKQSIGRLTNSTRPTKKTVTQKKKRFLMAVAFLPMVPLGVRRLDTRLALADQLPPFIVGSRLPTA